MKTELAKFKELHYLFCKDNTFNFYFIEMKPQDFSVYPNPNTGIFQVQTEENASQDKQIVISDLLGKQVYEDFYTGNILQFNLSDITSGSYIVSVKGSNSNTSKLMIINK